MNKEEARYYLQSSGFSEEQINTIEQAFKPKPTDNATPRDIFCMGCEYKEQEPCEMTAEEYRQRMIQAFHNADIDELIAVCVLPTEKEFEHLEWLLKNHYKKESCDDAISRQAVIDMLNNAQILSVESGDYCGYCTEDIDIDSIPSVNPQPKTGHWIEHPEIETSTPEYLMFYECSECGDRQCFCKSDIHKKRFCSNCGCRMVEP